MANKTKNILVTGFDGSDDDVMIFTETLTVEKVREKLIAKNQTFDDIYEVPTADLQYYIYEPCWIEETSK
jgi:hypothetical protein